MEFFENYAAIPALVIIVYLIAEAVKLIGGGALNKYIPIICGVLGATLAVVAFFFCPAYINASNLFEAIATGIISGLSATGINQIYKQMSGN